MNQTLYAPLDFYLAGGHSTGRASLSIYLSFFGAGISIGEFWKGVQERRKTHTLNFLEKYRRQGKKVGMAVDCLMWDYPGENLLGWKLPTVWLVRDPILLFTSFVNFYITGRITEAFYGKVTLVPRFDINELCNMVLNHPAEFYQFNKFLQCIPNKASVAVVDAEDTLADKVEESILRLLNFLKLDAESLPAQRDKLKISYGSLGNGLRSLPALPLYAPDGTSLTIHPTDREMLPRAAFWQVTDYHILTSITHGAYTYDMLYYADEPNPKASQYLTAANLERLADYLERGLNLADFLEKYCRAHRFPPDAVAEAIKKNKDMLKKFMHFWETDWVKVNDYSPGHTSRWEYARSIAE